MSLVTSMTEKPVTGLTQDFSERFRQMGLLVRTPVSKRPLPAGRGAPPNTGAGIATKMPPANPDEMRYVELDAHGKDRVGVFEDIINAIWAGSPSASVVRLQGCTLDNFFDIRLDVGVPCRELRNLAKAISRSPDFSRVLPTCRIKRRPDAVRDAIASRVDWFFREQKDIFDVCRVVRAIHAHDFNIHFVKAETYVAGAAELMWMHCIVDVPCGKNVDRLAEDLQKLANSNGWMIGGPFDHCNLPSQRRAWNPTSPWSEETLNHPFF